MMRLNFFFAHFRRDQDTDFSQIDCECEIWINDYFNRIEVGN